VIRPLAIAVAVAFVLVSMPLAGGIHPAPAGGDVAAAAAAPYPAPARPAHTAAPALTPITCTILSFEPSFFGISTLGPGCWYALASQQWQAYVAASALASAKNLMTLLFNGLNATASEVANLNATMSQLLTYFEGRAEALVPGFLTQAWNQTTYDQIAINSGLVPAIEGMEMAFATQFYQDWNATNSSWHNIFGPGGGFSGTTADIQFNYTGYVPPNNNHSAGILVSNNHDFRVTLPWEFWSGATPTGFGKTVYFNLAPGGTIVCVTNLDRIHSACPTYTVYDLSSHTNFTVPTMNLSRFTNATGIPVETTLHSVNQFDLLKLVCTANCGAGQTEVEVVAGYAFRNVTSANPDIFNLVTYGTPVPDTMVYQVVLANGGGTSLETVVPSLSTTICMSVSGTLNGPCSTVKVPQEGAVRALGSGPGSVGAGNNSLTRYASTMQALVNNTLLDAEVDYLTLRAITANGTQSVPPDCTIPPPSSEFPSSINPADYTLNLNEGLALYFTYLNSVARAFNNATTQGLMFCGNPNLALKFAWTGSWKLALNISASLYLVDSGGTPIYPNGTKDPAETYTNPATWPVRLVDPTLLFPYEFQWNIPVIPTVPDPIPYNDPLAGILVNYTANIGYGGGTASPHWGVPTYLNLQGHGNYVQVSGALSNKPSGFPNSTGDAVALTSCSLNGTPLSVCDIGVTYFNNFTYGHQSGLVGPPPPPGGGFPGFGGLSGLGSDCGFGNLNQWYDGWAGWLGSGASGIFSYIGSLGSKVPVVGAAWNGFWSGLGCVVAWLVVVFVGILLLFVAFWLGRALYRAGRGAAGPRRRGYD
jgi:hypothetical protein